MSYFWCLNCDKREICQVIVELGTREGPGRYMDAKWVCTCTLWVPTCNVSGVYLYHMDANMLGVRCVPVPHGCQHAGCQVCTSTTWVTTCWLSGVLCTTWVPTCRVPGVYRYHMGTNMLGVRCAPVPHGYNMLGVKHASIPHGYQHSGCQVCICTTSVPTSRVSSVHL